MKNVTNNFKRDIRTYGRQFDFKIKINNIDGDIDNFNYIKPSFNVDLFKTVMHKLEIDSKNDISKNSKINIQAGVKVNEPVYEYINYNTYTVTEPSERQEDTLSYIVKAYDKMVESMIDYDLKLTEKIKLREYLIKICQRLGWDTKNIPATFINSEKIIDPTLHIGIDYTFRDVLDEIATLSCSFLLFINDEFYMIHLNETNENIDESYLDEDNIIIGEKYFINSLVFSRAEESDNIYRKDDESIKINGLHEYRISDNQLLSTNDRDLYIDEMFNYLKTFEFYVFDVKSKGILFLEACDKFNFVLNGKTYSTILLNDEIVFEDGLTEDIYTDKPEETETEYKYADITDKKINKAYILVDKQNKKITQLTQETTENTENITKQEQTIEGIKTNVSSVETKVETVEGTATKALSDASKAQSTADTATTKANNAQTSANNAQSTANTANTNAQNAQNTANTANTNAQNAQKTADNNTTAITTTNKKVAEIETSVKGISATVSSHTESIEQVQEQTNINTDEIAKLGATKTVEGTYLTVDASNNPAKLYCYGNTEQATRSGKNLLNFSGFTTQTINGVTITNNNDGSFTLNGTSTDVISKRLSDVTYNLTAGTYYLSRNSSGTISGGSIATILYGRNDNAVNIGNLTTEEMKCTPTINYSEYYLWIYISAGRTFNNYVLKPQLEVGEIKTDWELYGVMPSPDYPSRIRNVGDNINFFDKSTITSGYRLSVNGQPNVSAEINYTSDFIPVTGNTTYIRTNTVDAYTRWCFYDSSKAFISKDDANQIITTPSNARYIRFSEYLSRIDTMKLEKGSKLTSYSEYNCGSAGFKVNNKNKAYVEVYGKIRNYGNGNFTSNNAYDGYIARVKPNTEYTVSFLGADNNVSNLCYFDKDMKYIKGDPFNIKNPRKFITPDNCEYITIAVMKIANNFMIEEGNTKTEFIEHKEQIKSFPFAEGQLLHKGDYLAEDGIHQVKKTIVLDGTETWYRSETNTSGKYRFTCGEFSNIKPTTTNNDIFTGNCTHFKSISANKTYSLVNGISGGNVGDTTKLYIFHEDFMYYTADEFEAYLAEQYANGTPVIAECELAEEIVIPYTPEQQKVLDSIETFKGINNIYCIDEIEPEKIVLTYYPNTPYNDTLVNKDTFDKVTTDMNAEFNIRANEVETSVREQTTASILTLLNNNYLNAEQVNSLVEGNAGDIATVKEQLKQTVTSSQMQIEITKAIEGGVSYLKNTLFTIDDKGMTIATNQDEFNALYSNKGMYLYTYEELMAKFDVYGTTIEGNLTLNGEFITPNLRMMNVETNSEPHVYIHWIGG